MLAKAFLKEERWDNAIVVLISKEIEVIIRTSKHRYIPEYQKKNKLIEDKLKKERGLLWIILRGIINLN